jgi:hypothetical protein
LVPYLHSAVKWRIVSPYLQFNSKAFYSGQGGKRDRKGKNSPRFAQMHADSAKHLSNTDEMRKRGVPWIALGCRTETCPRHAYYFHLSHNQSIFPAVLLNGRLDRRKPRHGYRCLSPATGRSNDGEFPLENALVWSSTTFQAKQARMRQT